MMSKAQKKRRLASKVHSGCLTDGSKQTIVINTIPDEDVQLFMGIDQTLAQGGKLSANSNMDPNNNYPADAYYAEIKDAKNGLYGLTDTNGGAANGYGTASKINSQTLKVKAPFETLNIKERIGENEASFANASSTFLRNHQKILFGEEMIGESGYELKHEPFYRHIIKD